MFGDHDGVVVIPKAIENDALDRAFAKVEGEQRSRTELLQGRLLGEVYEKYGVL